MLLSLSGSKGLACDKSVACMSPFQEKQSLKPNDMRENHTERQDSSLVKLEGGEAETCSRGQDLVCVHV